MKKKKAYDVPHWMDTLRYLYNEVLDQETAKKYDKQDPK